jgi:predicted negative regulator of RcsB-dependent stress response
MSSEATQTLSIYDVLGWLDANKRGLIIGAIAIVVIGFAVAAYEWRKDQTELAASDALLGLQASLNPRHASSQPSATALLKVAQDYPGTTAGERAMLLAAGTLFTDGKYPEAQEEFSKFVRERPQSPFAATAAYGVAACLEAEGKKEEALAAYQNLSVRFPNASVLDDSKLAIARIYQSKKQPEMALRIYDELARGGAMGGSASEAMMRKQELLSKYPNLAPTNAPAAASVKTIPVLKSTNAMGRAATNANPGKP